MVSIKFIGIEFLIALQNNLVAFAVWTSESEPMMHPCKIVS